MKKEVVVYRRCYTDILIVSVKAEGKWQTNMYALKQRCATFLHSRHTKYCRRVMAAQMVYGIDWPRQLLINRPQPKNVLFDVHNYPSLLLCHEF
jgi:hypothetical protein